MAGGARPLGGCYTLKGLSTLAIQGAGGRGRAEQRPQWSPGGEAERAELWAGRGRLVGVTPSKVHRLLLFKGRAVGGGLSNARSGAREAKPSRCACPAGFAAERSREGGVVGGAKPLGGRVG